ncbi:MAG: phytanoyl-CoA dioxygenase family protein [Alphaproteobacteria bacterium]|jgi:ectoine hydroxylase-related dioxygenase (phytanoyl-CoA dioxygenase family)|nr:phytanoyl-CoA dioxygenase family protein [Alphaproteobacteria bacterium]
MPSVLTPEEVAAYHEDGFVFVRGMFDAEEIDLLRRAMEEDPEVAKHSLIRADSEGGGTRISLWNRAGDSVYGMAARSERMVDTAEALIGEPVYHYQSKLTAKDPEVGGAWEWHQDYGYWYYNGCLRPDMLSTMIALDRTDADNGCLKLVRGSHKLGRLDHVQLTPEQNGADPSHMEHILEQYETVDCVLDPGDVAIFHSNTLHRSDQNRSERRRWTLLICYNAVTNEALVREDDRYYVPLDKVPDDAIKKAGLKFASGGKEHFASKPYVPDAREASGD